MKIIGGTQDGFILQATNDEVANLLGFSWSGRSGAPRLKVGSDIDVHSMFNFIHQIPFRRGQMKDLQAKFREIADSLDDPVKVLTDMSEEVGEMP